MEMNFPHKDLERTALDEGAAVAIPVADHQTLFAHAIARQASSQSARHYVAASKGLPGPLAAAHTCFMEDRMAFFAGRIRSDTTGNPEATMFESGCFRPDLAHKDINDMHG